MKTTYLKLGPNGQPADTSLALVPRVLTPEWISAYLAANAEYWRIQDAQPRPLIKWCNGTPHQATQYGYEAAMLAAAPTVEGFELPEQKYHIQDFGFPGGADSSMNFEIDGWNAYRDALEKVAK